MNIPKLHIEFVDNFLSKSTIDTDINIIPHATIIYLSLTQEIGFNDMARNFLEIAKDDNVNFLELLKINKHLLDIKNEGQSNTIHNNITTITLLNGKKINMVYRITVSKDDVLGQIFFITFDIEDKRASIDSAYNLYMLKDEIGMLKENLDSKGKEKLNEILEIYFDQENKQLSLEDLLSYEKELQAIQKAFPVLSRREILLCGLFANEMELTDIASVTNRSLNSVFVTIHRVNKKLNIPNKSELYRILQDIIANK